MEKLSTQAGMSIIMLQRLFLLASVIMLAGCAATGGSDARRMHTPEIPAAAARLAESMQGKPYAWGGETPGGFDCSGLVYYAYTEAGVRVPRTAREQYKAVRPLYVNQLAPGDLVFFVMPGRFPAHVGVYLGNSRFVHALNRNNPVMISSLDDDYWQRRLIRAGSLVR